MINKGIIYTILAHIAWGVIPVFFKLLQHVPPLQIMSHRVVWSFVLLGLILMLRGELNSAVFRLSKKVVLVYLCAGVLLALNWLIFVWAVNTGHVVEASLGYFINPMLSVLLGLVILKEKFRPFQWLPISLAAAGVIYLTIDYGSLPWVSLALALTFGLYGLVKKLAPLGSLPGVTLETALVTLPALAYLVFVQFNGQGAFVQAGLSTSLLLMAGGLVTGLPLLMFARGAQTTPLTTMGLIQYFTPTLQFMTGVFLYHETFSINRAIGFSIIWLALILFTADGLIHVRRSFALNTP